MPMLNDLSGEAHMHRSGVGSLRYHVRCMLDRRKCCTKMPNFIYDSEINDD